MIAQKWIVRAAAGALIASFLVLGQPGGSGAEMPHINNNDLVQVTDYVLQKQLVLQRLSTDVTTHGAKVGEPVKGEVALENIIPWMIQEGRAVSVVRVKAKGAEGDKRYSFAFIFTDDGYKISFLYPGTSNTDPMLFQDVYPAAEVEAASHLGSKEVTLKDTKVTGEIAASGWGEEWLWVDGKGKTHAVNIKFSTSSTGGGTIWSLKD